MKTQAQDTVRGSLFLTPLSRAGRSIGINCAPDDPSGHCLVSGWVSNLTILQQITFAFWDIALYVQIKKKANVTGNKIGSWCLAAQASGTDTRSFKPKKTEEGLEALLDQRLLRGDPRRS